MLRQTAICFVLFSLSVSQAADWKVPGIEIGKRAPDFQLKDQLGKPIQLSKLIKKGPVAVVFHRSANW